MYCRQVLLPGTMFSDIFCLCEDAIELFKNRISLIIGSVLYMFMFCCVTFVCVCVCVCVYVRACVLS